MTLKNQAIQTALDGNWQKAIDLNKDLVKEDPSDIDALNRLALAYAITGKLKEAKSAYQKVVKIDPLNSIALKNLKKLKDKNIKYPTNNGYRINNKFLEEPGKTKVIELVNIAPAKSIESLRTGQTLSLSVKRFKIFVLDDNMYIGVLPDDLAKRLIKFIKSGCIYEAYVKAATPHKVSVFIKEVKKMGKYKNQPSFISAQDSSFVVSKNLKPQDNSSKNQDEDDQNSYLEE